MTRDEARRAVVDYWMEKADQALSAAESDFSAGRPEFAMNRAYYACFYAASAVLLHEEKSFKRHSGVRVSLHAYLVRTGRLSTQQARLYDRLFEARLRLDYMAFASIDAAEARELIDRARQLVGDLSRMVRSRS